MAKLNKQIIGEFGQKVANAAQIGINRSKQLAEIARLRAANHSEEAAIKRAYIEIGKLYYAEHGEAPEGAYVALCSRISKSRDVIQQNLSQIEDLKNAGDISEADFDDQVQVGPEDFADEAAGEEAPVEEAPAAEDVVVEAAPGDAPEEAPIPDEE